jgi:glycosyltransferase involved in cell wall biosynthesis
VILSTYKNDASLDLILRSLKQQSIHGFELIIAEDAEEPSTAELVNSFRDSKEFSIVHLSQKDDGFRKSKILNAGISRAKGEYIILLDGDCVPHSKFIEDHQLLSENGYLVQGRRAFIRERAVAKVIENGLNLCSLVLKGHVYGLMKGIRLPKAKVKTDSSLNKTLGCNLGLWKSDLTAINGFDEAYEGWGREDSDLVARLFHLGLKRKLVHGRAIVYHLDHPIQSREDLDRNNDRLKNVLEKKLIRCSKGIVREC